MVGSALVIAFYFIRFKRFEDKIIQYLTDAIKTDPLIYFSFDDSSIRARTPNAEVTYHWSRIVRFNENEGDLYLYDDPKHIWMIISEEKIGADNYRHFREQLVVSQNTTKNSKNGGWTN